MVVSPRHGHQIPTLIINDEHGFTGFSEGTVTENPANPKRKGHSHIVQAPPGTPRIRVSRTAEARGQYVRLPRIPGLIGCVDYAAR